MSKLGIEKSIFIPTWGTGFVRMERSGLKWLVSTEESQAYFYDTREKAVKRVVKMLSKRIHDLDQHVSDLRDELRKLGGVE